MSIFHNPMLSSSATTGGGGGGGSQVGGGGGSGNPLISGGGYGEDGMVGPTVTPRQIDRSLVIGNSNHLAKPNHTIDRKTFTISFWLKLGNYDSSYSYTMATLFAMEDTTISPTETRIAIDAQGCIHIFNQGGGAPYPDLYLQTGCHFKDSHQWHHFCIAWDTTEVQDYDRVKIWRNGARITNWYVNYFPELNLEFVEGTPSGPVSLTRITDPWNYGLPDPRFTLSGMLADFYLIDGIALGPENFCGVSPDCQYVPIDYMGVYGPGGFHLDFSNYTNYYTSLGLDSSGNSHNFNAVGYQVSPTTNYSYASSKDTPTQNATLKTGNYCVLDKLNTLTTQEDNSTGTVGYINGRLGKLKWGNLFYENTDAYTHNVATSFPIPSLSGAWYFEAYALFGSGYVSIANANNNVAVNNISLTTSVTGFVYDSDTGELKKWNGTNYVTTVNCGLGDPYSVVYFTVPASGWLITNFGQRSFALTKPPGVKELVDYNLPEPIIDPALPGFARDVTQPGTTVADKADDQYAKDIVWVKDWDWSTDYQIYDTVRGSRLSWKSNKDDPQAPYDTPLGANVSAWGWKRSPSYGCDIVNYTGNGVDRLINHSLGVTPDFIIVKAVSGSTGAAVWHHHFVGAGAHIPLNTSDAVSSDTSMWGSSESRTSTQFSVGTNLATNGNGIDYIAYLFSEVRGFSKFGSLTMPGVFSTSTNLYEILGFRPGLLILKNASEAGDWEAFDGRVHPGNHEYGQYAYKLNNDDAVAYLYSPTEWDFPYANIHTHLFSSGFRINYDAVDPGQTSPSGNYIYAAWAKAAFKYSRAK